MSSCACSTRRCRFNAGSLRDAVAGFRAALRLSVTLHGLSVVAPNPIPASRAAGTDAGNEDEEAELRARA